MRNPLNLNTFLRIMQAYLHPHHPYRYTEVMDKIKVWDEAKDDKYKPYNFQIMKMNNKEFEIQLTNLGYAIATNELTQRVFDLTTYFLDTEPRNYNALYVRRCCVLKQLLELVGKQLPADVQPHDYEVMNLINKYELDIGEIKYDLKVKMDIGQSPEVQNQQLSLLQNEQALINRKIIQNQEHKAFSIWQYKTWLCETYCSILQTPPRISSATTITIQLLNNLYDQFSGDNYNIDIPINDVLRKNEELVVLPFFYQELIYQYLILLMDKKNYHCCNYIFQLLDNQHLKQDYELLRAFFDIVKREIQHDPKNNSMYTFMLKWYQIQINEYKDKINVQEIINQAITMCQNQITNESPYVYLNELALQLGQLLTSEQIQQLYDFLISQLKDESQSSQYPLQTLYHLAKQNKQITPNLLQCMQSYIDHLIQENSMYVGTLQFMKKQLQELNIQ